MERIGVSFTRGLTPTEVVECARLAEDLGYESAWVAEGHAGDQFCILTACAVATKQIRLGTSITSIFVRSAPTIAMAAATVDYFSRGRFILGLGTSHRVQVEPEHGLTFDQPLQRLRDTVEIVRRLLRDGEVFYKGSAITIQHFDFWFPRFRKEIPIYLAGVFPKMLQVCGEISQGALLVWSTLENARSAAQHVAQGARQVGRDPRDVDVAAVMPCAISASRKEARERMRGPIATYIGHFPRYRKVMAQSGFADAVEAVYQAWEAGDPERARRLVPDGLIEGIALAGTPEEVRERLAQYRKAGITLPLLSPRGPGQNIKAEAMEVIRACAPR